MTSKGITKLPNGSYRVRTKRGDTWHSGGTHSDPMDAQRALNDLIERVGPRAPTRVLSAPLKNPIFTERNIYAHRSGYQVRCTRSGVVHYGGTWKTIAEARTARDTIEGANPPKKTRKTKQP